MAQRPFELLGSALLLLICSSALAQDEAPPAPESTETTQVPSESATATQGEAEPRLSDVHQSLLAESRSLIVDRPSTDMASAERAYELAEQVYDATQDSEARYRMANAAWRLARSLEAHEMLIEVLADTEHPFVVRGRDLMQEQLAQWESTLARLQIECAEPNVRVYRGEEAEPFALTPLSGNFEWVLPGTVRIRFEGAGWDPTRQSIEVPGGQMRTLRCELIPIGQSEDDDDDRAAVVVVERERRRPIFLVLAGVGAVAMAASGATWAMGSAEVSDLDDRCATTCSVTTFNEGQDTVRRLDRATSGLLIGGAAFAALSVSLYFLWPETWREVDEGTEQPAATVEPVVSREGAGALATLRF